MIRDDIYRADYVSALFDDMAYSYDRVNLISSFGFSKRWRHECIRQTPPATGMAVADLMTGVGDAWPQMLPLLGREGNLIAIDFSDGMLNHARIRQKRYPEFHVQILKENALSTSIAGGSVDRVYCLFGLKTLAPSDIGKLADETKRILKTGGTFSFIEVSVPENPLLRFAYMPYLKFAVPVIGRIFLGNPETYKMLGIYTEKFVNCRSAARIFEDHGLRTNYHNYFFGCASGFSGSKTSITS